MPFSSANFLQNMSIDSQALERENRRLKSLLSDLVHRAEDNERLHKKFSDFEFQLLSAESLQDFFNTLIHDMPARFEISKVCIELYDPEHTARELLNEDYIKQTSQQIEFLDSVTEIRDHFEDNQVRLFKPNRAESGLLFHQDELVKSAALLPLVRHDFLFGSINLGSYDISRFSSNLATHFLTHLASIISVCVENVLNQEQLRMLSLIDVLTRVKNRRCFNKELTQELTRAHRRQQPISCLFIDLDFFKKVNDTYGHQAGDKTLKLAANAIQQLLRKTDLLARFGGEEFVVLLPYTDSKKAQQTAERIRKTIEQLAIEHENNQFGITTSIGISTWQPTSDITLEQIQLIERSLVHCTDKAVYVAKESGRNRVVIEAFELL